MKDKSTFWAVLALIMFIMVALMVTPPIRPPKARAQRISTVNNVSRVTLVLTKTNATPGPQPGINE